MKKLLVIVVLGFLLNGNVYTDDKAPIKHKRIECKSSDWPQRYNNHFLIISDDEKTAELITIPWGKVEKFKANVSKNLMYITITFEKNDSYGKWLLRRSDGSLELFTLNNLILKRTCEPFSKDLDPEEFLNNQIKLNIEKTIKNNKF